MSVPMSLPSCRDTDQTLPPETSTWLLSGRDLQAVLAPPPDPAGTLAGQDLSGGGKEEGKPCTELTHLPLPPPPLMSWCFSSGTREAVAPGAPPSSLPPEQLLAGGARDIKGIKLPWNSFTKVPHEYSSYRRREIKVAAD